MMVSYLPVYPLLDHGDGLLPAPEVEGEVGGEDGVLKHPDHSLELILTTKYTV